MHRWLNNRDKFASITRPRLTASLDDRTVTLKLFHGTAIWHWAVLKPSI